MRRKKEGERQADDKKGMEDMQRQIFQSHGVNITRRGRGQGQGRRQQEPRTMTMSGSPQRKEQKNPLKAAKPYFFSTSTTNKLVICFGNTIT